jgi:hypothetical protein
MYATINAAGKKTQRPQVFDHLLARDTVMQHLWRHLEAAAEVDERVAGNDCA